LSHRAEIIEFGRVSSGANSTKFRLDRLGRISVRPIKLGQLVEFRLWSTRPKFGQGLLGGIRSNFG